MRQIQFHPAVPSEVREILAYYAGISPKLGNDLRTELGQCLEYARQFPERHHFDPGGRRRSNLGKFPYHFLFQIFETTIVRHNRTAGVSPGNRALPQLRKPGFGGRSFANLAHGPRHVAFVAGSHPDAAVGMGGDSPLAQMVAAG